VPELLKEMDLFVYASRCDTFGIAVAEAVATGMPVMVNDWDVMREVTAEGKWAWLYPSGNVDALFDLYTEFIQHPDTFVDKAIEHAHAVREAYSIEKHVETLNSIYRSILK
jgi:glycosyltransferase involved in cell wall biosynthesis